MQLVAPVKKRTDDRLAPDIEARVYDYRAASAAAEGTDPALKADYKDAFEPD